MKNPASGPYQRSTHTPVKRPLKFLPSHNAATGVVGPTVPSGIAKKVTAHPPEPVGKIPTIDFGAIQGFASPRWKGGVR